LYSINMSNYTMPPRSRASDYAKGKISQDEIISLQIANDANIAAARKAIKLGEVQQLTPAQTASPDELLADDAAQEANAMSNIRKLGFRDQEVSQIITNIRGEANLDFQTLNANFPAIEADIKKRFNVKLLTPTFVIEYLKKYADEIADATGLKNVFNPNNAGLNNLVNTVAELRQVIPDPAVIEYLRRAAQDSRAVGQLTLDELDRLKTLLPNARDLQALSNLAPVQQQRIIDQLLVQFANMPSEADIRALATNIQADRIDRRQMVDAIKAIVDAIPRGNQQNIAQQAVAVAVGETFEEATARRDRAAGRPAPVERAQIAVRSLGDLVNSEADFNGLRIGNKKAFITQVGLAPYLRDANGNRMYVTNLSTPNIATTNANQIVLAYLQLKGRIPENTKIAESGLDAEFRVLVGQGIRGIKPNIRMKVGRGISVKETPSYREYGKYAIHIPQLEQQDILNVKYKSLGQIPKFKPIPVSDIFRDFIIDLIENGKPNARVYTQIAPDERKFFEEMSIGAGVWNGLGLKRTTTNTDEEEAKRFELLKGEYVAGNNNPKVISELRKLVVKMMSDGRIRKNQGVELLMELSI
jgi:hypothetical protein